MGKGDKKSKRGKIIKGSFGNSRLKRKTFGNKEPRLHAGLKTGIDSEPEPDI